MWQTKQSIHLYQYRKHKNLVANLNEKEKKNFWNSLTIENEFKPFWETCQPYFSDEEIKVRFNLKKLKLRKRFSFIFSP